MDSQAQKKLLLSLATFLSIGLFSCSPKVSRLETDLFIYEINNKGKYATLMRLTELGMEQEILVIPPVVDGFPVKFIGEPPALPLLGEGMGTLLLGYTVKKIYLPFSLDDRAWLAGLDGMEIVLNKADPSVELIDSISRFSEAELFYINDGTKLNTFFMYNYEEADNQGYYWVDYIDDNNPYAIPSNPSREGYTFSGWYYEEDGTTLWDNRVPTSGSETLTLYARWN